MVLRWWRALVPGVLLVLAVALALFTPNGLRLILFERNFRQVMPGVYRSAQPTRADLVAWAEAPGIRSVLSLRRPKPHERWYQDEIGFVQSNGVAHYSVPLSGELLPPPPELWEILQILDTAPRPLLMHCSAGVERSGLGAALTLLLEDGEPVRARKEFGRDRGYMEWLGFSDLARFVDLYAAWLEAEGAEPSRDHFRRWATTVYAPYFYRAELELVGREGKRFAIRVTNRSGETIPFRGGGPGGVRLGAHWHPVAGEVVELRGDPADRDLDPGASFELGVSAPPEAARGVLVVDLVHEGRKWFAEMGSPTLSIPIATESP